MPFFCAVLVCFEALRITQNLCQNPALKGIDHLCIVQKSIKETLIERIGISIYFKCLIFLAIDSYDLTDWTDVILWTEENVVVVRV